MHISKVYIKGFRNFKEETINFGKPSLIIGANDVGKTNLIYALRLLLDKGFSEYDYEPSNSDFYAYEDMSEIIIRIYFANIKEECVTARMPGYISNQGEMVLQYCAKRDTTGMSYNFYCGKSDSEEDMAEISNPFYRRYLNLKYISSRRDFWAFIQKSKTLLLKQAKDNRNSEFIEADTILYNEIQQKLQYVDTHIPSLSYVRNATQKINAELNKLSIHNQEQKIVFDTSSTDIDKVISSVSLASKHLDRTLAIGGDGRLNQIYLSLWASQNEYTETSNEVSIICVEEPEAYLHPHQQRALAAYFQSIMSEQVLVTTHSPYIIGEFAPNSIIRLYKNETNATVAASNGCSTTIAMDIEDFGYRMSVIPAEAFFADFVILVEGQSEMLFYKTLAKQINVNLDRLNISVLSVEGIQFKTFIKILSSLNIPWTLRTDNDIIKVPNKNEYRYAGIERGIDIIQTYCSISTEDEAVISINAPLLKGFNDVNNIPEKNYNAANALRDILRKYNVLIATVDLETDLFNSSIKSYIKEFYGTTYTDEEIIKYMKDRKATNMFVFLRKKKERLITLKEDDIALPLIIAKEKIINHYGTI